MHQKDSKHSSKNLKQYINFIKKNKDNHRHGIIGDQRNNQQIQLSSEPEILTFDRISYKFIIKA
jgi:hypothetical protein